MKKIKVDKKKLKKVIIITMILIVIFILIILKYKNVFETKKKYTVINGYVEKIDDCIGILIKDEK